MPRRAPKAREDLEYFEQVIDDDDVVFVRDPVRGTYIRFNPLQAAMLRALDGHRTAAEITAVLSEEYEVEIPPVAAERFVERARDLMLLEITSYRVTPSAARKQVRKALRKAGYRTGAPERRDPRDPPADPPDPARPGSIETALFAEALRQLDLDHPRAAAAYLAQLLEQNPEHARARELHELIQTAYIRAHGGTTDFPTWALFNPERMLTWMSRAIGRFLFGWPGVLAILAFLCVGGYAYSLVEFGRIEGAALEIAIAIAILFVSGMIHELGHGLACQHYGGSVTEIGVMLFYYVEPAAYCDTSSSYLITERRHKMMIQLAGSIVSLLILAMLAIVLASLNPDVPVYPGLALGLIITSGLAFMSLFPFIKNDGYYALCDYFGFPNLRDRAFKLARAWLGRRLLGLELPAEELPPRTRRLLLAYAAAAFVFTALFVYFVYFRLLAPVIEHFRGAGLLFAITLTAYLLRNMVLRPIWDAARLIVRERRQIFTRRRTAALLAIAAALAGPWFLRWPVLVDAEVVVAPRQRAEIRAQVAGRVHEVLVAEGDRIRRGEPLARLRDPALRARIATLEAELEAASHHLDRLRRGARPEELALAHRRLAHARAEARRAGADADLAGRLAAASLGSRSAADAAGARTAARAGEAGAAQGALALLAAGARPEELAVAEAARARLAHELAHLRTDEARLTLTSPIDGVVVTPRLEDQLHAALAPGDLFAEVHDLDRVVARISLAPSDPLAELAIGDEVEIRLRGAPHAEIRARVARLREAAEEVGGATRLVAITSPFALERPTAGLTGHARIHGAERSLAYAHLYLPLQRLVRVRLWSMW